MFVVIVNSRFINNVSEVINSDRNCKVYVDNDNKLAFGIKPNTSSQLKFWYINNDIILMFISDKL